MSINSVPKSAFKISETQSKALSLLVHLLRNNGDKVLNGSTKLSLTTTVLHVMNEGFTHIVDEDLDKSFNVQSPTHFKQTIYQDLMCLYDFVQKTVGLKVTHGITTLQHNVNLVNFRALEVLEIKKIPVHMIVGLKSLRERLTTVICSRCLNKLQDLFEMCGADRTEPSVWLKLKIAILNYNNIDELDSSLVLLPNLQALDLGHNSIRNTLHLESLNNLKWLNLSYNYLESIPNLSFEARFRLRTLSLRNNNLEDLNGVESLHNLEELDVGYNCLVQHAQLKPLHFLKCLKSLWLDGNPLSFRDKHRFSTMSHLQPDVITAKFQLDGQHFTSRELQEAKKLPRHVSPSSSSGGFERPNSDLTASSGSSIVAQFPRRGSINSLRSYDASEEFTTSTASTSSLNFGKKKKHKIREISIEDSPEKNESEHTNDETDGKISEHLETKEKVEKFRKELGSSWLVASSRLSQSDVPSKFMGGAPLPKPVKPFCLEVKNNSENEEVVGEITIENSGQFSSSSKDDDVTDCGKEFTINEDRKSTGSSDKDCGKFTNNGEESRPGIEKIDDSSGRVTLSDEQDSTFVWANSDSENSSLSDNNLDNPAFDDEQPFIVDLHRFNDVATLLVSIQGDNLRERDSLTGRTLECLDIRSLLSMEKLSDPVCGLRLTFDYIRKDRRERIYALEDETNCQLFMSLLQPVLEARTMEDMMRGALQCLACGAQFSKEVAKLKLHTSKTPMNGEPENIASDKDYLREVNACPNCDSHMVIEMDDAPLPKTPVQTEISKNVPAELPKPSVSKKSVPLSRLLKEKFRQKELKTKTKPVDLQISDNNEQHSSKSLPATPVLYHRQLSALMESQKNRGQLERVTRDQLFSNSESEPEGSPKMKSRSLDCSPLSSSPGSSQIPYSEVYSPRDETREASIVNIREESPDYTKNTEKSANGGSERKFSDNMNVFKYSFLSGGNSSGFSEFENGSSENKERRHSTPVITAGMRRSESDVTILSNPSQSSISVLSTPSVDQPLDSILETTTDLNLFHSGISSELTLATINQLQREMVENKNRSVINSNFVNENETFGSSSSGSVCSSTGTTIEKSSYLGSKKIFSPRLDNTDTSTDSIFESVGTVPSSGSSTFHSVAEENDFVDGATSPSTDGEFNSKPEFLNEQISNNNSSIENDELSDTINTDELNISICNLDTDDVVQSNMMKYSYDNYTQIDHRIRLYVDMTLFGEGESFELILKSTVVAPTKLNEFIGLLIISTKNIYLLRIIGEENNEPSKWLQKVDVKPLSQLKAVKAHLGCQGFILEFGSTNSISYLFLVRDVDRCNRFMDKLVDLEGVFGSADVIRNPEQSVKNFLQSALNDEGNRELLNTEENFDEILLYILGSLVKEVKGKKTFEPVSFVVTPNHVHIFTENNQSYVTSPKSGKENLRRPPFQFKDHQKISDLIAASLTHSSGEVKLCFLHEDSGLESEWYIAMETSRSMSQLVTAIQEPWKMLFNIDLPITRC